MDNHAAPAVGHGDTAPDVDTLEFQRFNQFYVMLGRDPGVAARSRLP